MRIGFLHQRRMMLRQLAMKLLKLGIELLDFLCGAGMQTQFGEVIELLANRAIQVALIALRIVNDRAQASQFHRLQAIHHDIERSALVADEKHALPTRQMVADDVGDGLTFAGPRRAVNDQAAGRACELYRAGLAWIGGEDETLFRKSRVRFSAVVAATPASPCVWLPGGDAGVAATAETSTLRKLSIGPDTSSPASNACVSRISP